MVRTIVYTLFSTSSVIDITVVGVARLEEALPVLILRVVEGTVLGIVSTCRTSSNTSDVSGVRSIRILTLHRLNDRVVQIYY